MKKIKWMSAALGTCLLLTACTPKEAELFTDPTESQTLESLETQETPGTPETQETAPIPAQPEAGYAYGNMQKNIPSGNYVVTDGSVLFYNYNQSGDKFMLYTMDMETEAVTPFCKDATCAHTGGSCAAYGVSGNLEQYGDAVYALGRSDAMKQLQDGLFEDRTEGGINHFWHSQDTLYVQTEDASLMAYESASTEPKMLIEEYNGYWETVFGDFLYFSNAKGYNRLNLQNLEAGPELLLENVIAATDGKHIYYAPEDTLFLYRCDMDGKNSELLLEKSVLPASWNFDEEFFYFRLFEGDELYGPGSNVVYRFPKDHPEQVETIAELDQPVYQIYVIPGYDRIFVECQADDINVRWPVVVMGRDGSDIHALELP